MRRPAGEPAEYRRTACPTSFQVLTMKTLHDEVLRRFPELRVKEY